MSLVIYVDAYSGFKANERPLQFHLDESIYEIAAVLSQTEESSLAGGANACSSWCVLHSVQTAPRVLLVG